MGGADDGAQIELNGAGLIIRETDATAGAVVSIGGENAMIPKDQTLTLEENVQLTVPYVATSNRFLWLAGDAEGGAKLLGEGELVSLQTRIKGGQYGWQAYGVREPLR
jgi:hypothetical protein